MSSKKIGILSGAFDPIHNGHIELAHAAYKQGELDRVLLLPERVLRRKTNVIDFEHRLAMCKLAAKDFEWLEVLELPDEQFTIADTLPELQTMFSGSQLVFILGSDLFASLPDWAGIEQLTTEVSFVVSLRDDFERTLVEKIAKEIRAKFALVDNKLPYVSSSKVRAKLKAHEKAEVTQSVGEYIKTHGLY